VSQFYGGRTSYVASPKQLNYARKLAFARTLNGIQWVEELRVKFNAGSTDFDANVVDRLLQAQRDGARARRLAEPATDNQVEYATKLLAERVEASMLPQELVVSHLTKGEISLLIDNMLKMKVPYKVVDKDTGEVTRTVSIPLGTYTVVLGDENDYVTLRVENASFIKDAKKVMVSYLCGSDNDFSYKGFAFVNPSGLAVWNKFKSDSRVVKAAQVLWALAQTEAGLGEAHEAFLKEAEAYALRSGNCMRCHKTLTVPASLSRGLGPVCAEMEIW
jgi:Family of unknown function (DUF6011)